jgi:outer membrane protein assembly factor BamB
VYNGIVYAGGEDGKVHAFDAKTGLERWSYQTGGVITSSPVMDTSNAFVYFVSSDGNLYAVCDGTEQWKFRLSAGGSSDTDPWIHNQIRSSPALDTVTGILYAGSWDNAVYAVHGGPASGNGGTQVWKHATGGHVTSSPAIDKDNRLILVGCDDNQLYALKIDDNGNEAWKYRTSGDGLDRGWLIEGSPAVRNNVVYFGCGGYTFYAMDVRTQQILWTFKTSLGTETSPAIADGYVYFGSRNGNVYALDMADGQKKWEYATGDVVYSSPSVSNGILYIGSNTGKVIAMGNKAPVTEWQKALGGTKDDRPRTIRQTNDGGYITIGSVASNDGDVSGNHGGSDIWVVKQSSSGAIEWQKCLGGTKGDFGLSIEQTADNGYVLVGATISNDGDVSGNHGNEDIWVVKLSPTGSIVWHKCLGGSGNDVGRSIQQTSDGGYIISGFTESSDGDVSGNHGGRDVWVIKLSPDGQRIEWQKCLGGSGNDEANSIRQTADGGYFVVGFTESNDGDVSGNHGGRDVWAVKLSPTGTIKWQKCLGGTNNDEGETGLQTSDGGYIISGTTNSNNGDVSGNHGASDIWIVKLSSTGSIEWQKCLGGLSDDVGDELALTRDGGYIVVGSTLSQSGDVTYNNGLSDVWVAKLDNAGNLLEQKSLGGTGVEYGRSVQQTADGGFIVAGSTLSPEINDGKSVIYNHASGSGDFYIIKLKDPFQTMRLRTTNAIRTGAFSEAPYPAYVNDLVHQGASDAEIQRIVEETPIMTDSTLTDDEREFYLKQFQEVEKARTTKITEHAQGSYDCQKDGGMRINEKDFSEISGYSHGGPLETSSSSDTGTTSHYFTSHLGHADGTGAHWIEVGMAKFYSDPTKAVVFTYDNDRNPKWNTTLKNVASNSEHNYYIRIYADGSSYSYIVYWDSNKIESGTYKYLLNDVDANHEFFSPACDKFSKVSTAYFHDLIVKKPNSEGVAVSYYWNDKYLTEETKDHGPMDPVKMTRTVPSTSESYRVDTWIP